MLTKRKRILIKEKKSNNKEGEENSRDENKWQKNCASHYKQKSHDNFLREKGKKSSKGGGVKIEEKERNISL